MKVGLRMPGMRAKLGETGVVEWAAAVGLDSVDLLVPDPAHAAVIGQHGLVLGSIDSAGRKGLLSPDQNEQARGVEEAVQRVEAVAALGGKVLFEVLAPADPGQPRSKSFAIWKETYPAVVAAAEQHNVKIAIEPYPGSEPYLPNLGTNPEMLRLMFAAIPSPALGICYDPSHFRRLRIDHIRLLMEFAGRIHHVHAKDCQLIPEGMYLYGILGESFGRRYRNGGGSWRYCIPGHGDLSWSEIIFHLGAAGYDGVLAIELEDHQYMDTMDTQKRAIELSARFLRDLF